MPNWIFWFPALILSILVAYFLAWPVVTFLTVIGIVAAILMWHHPFGAGTYMAIAVLIFFVISSTVEKYIGTVFLIRW